MDTNINNYSTKEILQLIKLSEKECSLDNVYYVITDILKKIKTTENLENKNQILFFFNQCFAKICQIYHYHPTETMKQNIDFILYREHQQPQHEHEHEHEPQPQQEQEQPVPYVDKFVGTLPVKVPEMVTISANQDKYARGLVNPLKRETIKNILTIHSKFRPDMTQSTTDFSVTINEPFNNVVSLKLASIELMNSYYAISDYLKTNRFTVETYLLDNITNAISNFYSREIQISEGSYTIDNLYPVINDLFNADVSLNMLTTKYNSTKGKIYFRLKEFPIIPPPAGKRYAFNLVFTVCDDLNRPIFCNMGWLFGFMKSKYTFLKDYVSVATTTKEIGFNPEAPFDCTGTKFFLLEVNDYNNNSPAVLKYNIQDKYTFNVKDILAKIPNTSTTYCIIFEDSSDRIFKSRNYFGPVKLNKLRIKLLDDNGRVVNLNNSDIVISLEIESLDVPYKNMIK